MTIGVIPVQADKGRKRNRGETEAAEKQKEKKLKSQLSSRTSFYLYSSDPDS